MSSHNEARIEYRDKMGEQLGTAYHLLWDQCAQVHIRWTYYCELFGTDQAAIDVMNGVAPGLFSTIHDVLWESVLLEIAKFRDPLIVAGKKPLSLALLSSLIPARKVAELDVAILDMQTKTAFAREWRNRHIAHWDYELAADKAVKPLAFASRHTVEEALTAIVRVLDAIDMHFTGASLQFDGDKADAGHLLNELRLIQQLRDERQGRLLDGTATMDDMDWKKWH